MGILKSAILALGAYEVFVTAAVVEKRQGPTTKYCPGSTSVCFSEFSTPTSNIVYRIAIPDVPNAPFDILLQIVAPVSITGWAGLAWGGSMTKNPLTVGWASGSSAIVSSRWAIGHTLPQPYTGATYTVLPTSTTNATHWQLDVLCSGCSQWGSVSLNPNGPNTFAWAKGSRAVTTASSNTSTFAYHDDKGVFSHDLSLAKIPKGVFDALAYDAGNTVPSPSSTAVSSTAVVPPTPTVSATTTTSPPTVITSVTTLPPRPSHTTTTITTATSLSRPTVITSVTTLPPRPTTTPTTIITRPTTSITWTPDQPLTPPPVTTRTTTVIPPKPSTTAVSAPPWAPPFGIPPWGRPPWRGPPWRRPPGGEGEEAGVE